MGEEAEASEAALYLKPALRTNNQSSTDSIDIKEKRRKRERRKQRSKRKESKRKRTVEEKQR